MADEIIYYADQSGVRVTDKSVIIGSITYSTASITSVTAATVNPTNIGPKLAMVVGFAILVDQTLHKALGSALFGALVLTLGYFWYREGKPIWHLRITSALGETTPLRSVDQNRISSIAQAINEAIIHRT